MGPGDQVTPSLQGLKAHPGHLWLSYLSCHLSKTYSYALRETLCPLRLGVFTKHLTWAWLCRKLLRHDWHLQDACRSLPQQLSLHGGWHTYACIKIFLVDLGDFQLSRTHLLGIPSSANSMIDVQHILQTSFLAKICCFFHYMNFPP